VEPRMEYQGRLFDLVQAAADFLNQPGELENGAAASTENIVEGPTFIPADETIQHKSANAFVLDAVRRAFPKLEQVGQPLQPNNSKQVDCFWNGPAVRPQRG